MFWPKQFYTRKTKINYGKKFGHAFSRVKNFPSNDQQIKFKISDIFAILSRLKCLCGHFF